MKKIRVIKINKDIRNNSLNFLRKIKIKNKEKIKSNKAILSPVKIIAIRHKKIKKKMIICILVYKEGNQLMEWKSYKDKYPLYTRHQKGHLISVY